MVACRIVSYLTLPLYFHVPQPNVVLPRVNRPAPPAGVSPGTASPHAAPNVAAPAVAYQEMDIDPLVSSNACTVEASDPTYSCRWRFCVSGTPLHAHTSVVSTAARRPIHRLWLHGQRYVLVAHVTINVYRSTHFLSSCHGIPMGLPSWTACLCAAIMIVSGDYIEMSIGVTLGISTLCAAALGNVIADVLGLNLGGVIEELSYKLGVPEPRLSRPQMEMKITRVVAVSLLWTLPCMEVYVPVTGARKLITCSLLNMVGVMAVSRQFPGHSVRLPGGHVASGGDSIDGQGRRGEREPQGEHSQGRLCGPGAAPDRCAAL